MFLPYGHQSIDDDDVRAVVETLRSDWLTQGPAVDAFERDLAEICSAAYAVAFNSGTAALHAACAAAGLGAGDEVLTSPLSFAASANCARYVGAMPGFVDVDARTLSTPAEAFAARVGPTTRAVIPVHYAGRPVALEPLAEARAHGVVVIEDAAHALGSVGPAGPVGNCATSDMACFSFHPVKTITTGEGGAVTTNDAALAERLRVFRRHGTIPWQQLGADDEGPWYYEIDELGMNYRITDFQCALGSSQLRKLDRFVRRRGEIAALYLELLAGSGIELQAPAGGREVHAYHLVVALLPVGCDRRRVYDAMRAAGIGVQVHYVPIYRHPYYRRLGFDGAGCPVTEGVYPRLLSLPVFPDLRDEDVRRVVETLEREVGRADAAP